MPSLARESRRRASVAAAIGAAVLLAVALLVLSARLGGAPAWTWALTALAAGAIAARLPHPGRWLCGAVLAVAAWAALEAWLRDTAAGPWSAAAGALLTAGLAVAIGWTASALAAAGGRGRWPVLAPVLILAVAAGLAVWVPAQALVSTGGAPGVNPRDVFRSPGDLSRTHGEAVAVSDAGGVPAWVVEGRGPVTAVMAHGRGATRRESLRALAALPPGMPAVIVTHRGGEGGAPEPDDGFARLGGTEWRDLEAGVRLALDDGAREVVLVGHSMGGGMALTLLRRSPLAGRVRAVILDAPTLDWRSVLAQAAARRRLPRALVAPVVAVAEYRTGYDLDDIDQLRAARELSTPILIIHGDADETVPIRPSRALAAARPDLVTLHEVAGAGHLEGWNVDPDGYRRIVRAFLAGVLGGADSR